MFSTSEELVAYIGENDVEVFDIRFCDLLGIMNHLAVPASTVTRSTRWPAAWPSTARPSRASSRSTNRT